MANTFKLRYSFLNGDAKATRFMQQQTLTLLLNILKYENMYILKSSYEEEEIKKKKHRRTYNLISLSMSPDTPTRPIHK